MPRPTEADQRWRDLHVALDRYLAELTAEVGEPSATDRAEAEALARRVRRHIDEGRT